MMDKDRMPGFDEYLAGIVLANSLVWAWSFLLSHFKEAPQALLRSCSYIICFLSVTLASYLVSLRASRKYLIIGLKVSILSWLVALPRILFLATKLTLNLILLLFCFTAGGMTGSYLALKKKLRL